MTRMRTLVAALTVAATLGAGGCSSDQPPVCDSLDAVQATVNNIRTLNVAENGLTALQGYLAELQADVRQLRSDAAAQFATQVDAVQAAAAQTSASVAAARETPDVGNLGAVRTTVDVLRTELRSLGDAMSGTC